LKTTKWSIDQICKRGIWEQSKFKTIKERNGLPAKTLLKAISLVMSMLEVNLHIVAWRYWQIAIHTIICKSWNKSDPSR